MNQSRRMFLKGVVRSVGAIPSLSPLSLGPTIFEATDSGSGPLQDASNRTLVVVQLMGGNDGLNTVVPYGQQAYYANRPTIGITTDQVLQIDGNVGLNPQMSGIMGLYKANQAAIIQGVSYPNPNLSHYEATAIWESGSVSAPLSNGWLGRYLDVAQSADTTVKAVNVDGLLPQTLQGVNSSVLTINNLNQFKIQTQPNLNNNAISTAQTIQMINQAQCQACNEYNSLVQQMMQTGLDSLTASALIAQAASNYQTSVTYPNNDFSNRLKLAAGIITSSIKPRIVYVQLGGFDTHTNQKATQDGLLKMLSDGAAAFYNDLSAKGRANDTLIMTFSEFGRRVKENGNKGTDHGTSEPQFVIGGKVSSGLYGSYPSLTDLDPSGNLKMSVDYRQLYASVLEDWLGISQTQVLDSTYNKLSVFQ